MSFVMFDNFIKYGGWQMKIIETCQRFYEKYNRFPNYIRMKEKTMDALFDEDEQAFLDPYSEEHAVRDLKGELLIPLQITEDDSYKEPEELADSDKNFINDYIETHTPEEKDIIIEEDDVIYPMEFGVNDDGTVSFITNKFELVFLEGEELPEDYYIVQFGEGPDDGGEDFEEEDSEELPQITLLAA